jgi:hypothetical protein
MKTHIILTSIQTESVEDGGQAIISEKMPIHTMDSDEENGMYVILGSWDEDTVHKDFNDLKGKKFVLLSKNYLTTTQ